MMLADINCTHTNPSGRGLVKEVDISHFGRFSKLSDIDLKLLSIPFRRETFLAYVDWAESRDSAMTSHKWLELATYLDDDRLIPLVQDYVGADPNLNSSHYNLALIIGAKLGHLDLVRYLVGRLDPVHINQDPLKLSFDINQVMHHAALRGHRAVLSYLIKSFDLVERFQRLLLERPERPLRLGRTPKGSIINLSSVLTSAATRGHLEVLQDLIKTFGIKPNDDILEHLDLTLNAACSFGQLEVVIFLIDYFQLGPGDSRVKPQLALIDAANAGYLIDLTKEDQSQEARALYLQNLFEDGQTPNLTKLRLSSNYFHLVQLLVYKFQMSRQDLADQDYEPLNRACQMGRLDIVSFFCLYFELTVEDLRSQDYQALVSAAYDGHLLVVKFLDRYFGLTASHLKENKFRAVKLAALQGQAKIVQYFFNRFGL